MTQCVVHDLGPYGPSTPKFFEYKNFRGEHSTFDLKNKLVHMFGCKILTYQALRYTSPMTTINPHINFNGNAEEAFTFYKSVFGGEFGKIVRFKDLAHDDFKVSPHEENKVMHIELPIGPTRLMGNDVPEVLGKTNERENRSKISVSVDAREEVERIYNELSVGGEVEMPLGESPWGTHFAMFRDKYGIEWMVECAGRA
jgi:PhnB protein